MTRTRGVAAALTIAVGLLALTACSKPNPGIAVVSGTSSAHEEAICWAFDAPALNPGQCAQAKINAAATGGQVPSVKVVPGNTIGISVDPVVADAGWYVAINGQRLTPGTLHTSYYRFSTPDSLALPAAGAKMQIVAGSGTQPRGLWLFTINSA